MLGNLRLVNLGVMNGHHTAYDVVKHLGAMQAQDYKQALWAIGARIPNSTISTVEAEIETGVILRTWAMRGTIHFIPTEDTQWMIDLCASRALGSFEHRMRQLDLTQEIVFKSLEILQKALTGKKALSRAYLMNLLDESGISTEGQRGYHILAQLGNRGLIAIGPTLNNEQTFILPDEWATMRRLSREESLAELVKRFFMSHAPATEQDFARWTGLTLTDTRRGIESVKPHLRQETIDGTTYYLNAESPTTTIKQPKSVRLLAGFDEFLLGYKDRDTILPPEYAQQVVPGNNGVFKAIIVVDGVVSGTWNRQIKSKAVHVTLHPFESLDGLDDQIHAELEKYSQFMALPVILDKR